MYSNEKAGLIIPLELILLISAGILLVGLFLMLRIRRRVRLAEQEARWNVTFSSSLALSEVIAAIRDELTHHFPGAQPAIYAVDNDSESMVRIRNPISDVDATAAHVLKTGKSLALTDQVQISAHQLGLRLVTSVDALFAVPLKYAQEQVGVVVLTVRNSPPHVFTPSEARNWITTLERLARSASPALRNAVIYGEASQMADQLAFLSRISSMVTSNLDVQGTLDTITRLAGETVRADYVAIFLNRDDNRAISLVHSLGLSPEYVELFQDMPLSNGGMFPYSSGMKPITIQNVYNDPAGLGWRALSQLVGYTSLAIIPLATKDITIGFLVIYYKQEHLFDRYEVDTLAMLSGQLSVTLANTRLYQSEQKRAQQMMRLADASRVFTSSLDLGNVTSKVLEELYNVILPDKCVVLLEDSEGELRITAQRNLLNSEALNQLARTPTLIKAIESGTPVTLPETPEDLVLLDKIQVESLFCAPLVSQGKSIGLVLLGHQRKRGMSSEENQLVGALVNQAAVAIRNAQLFAQVDEALDERILELSAIEKISRKISGLLNLDEIIADVLDTALEVTDASVAMAALVTRYDPDYFTMIEHYSSREGVKPSRGVIRRNQGIIGQVFRTGNIAWVGDVRSNNDYLTLGMKGMHSVLCVPIMNQGECIGAINLESRKLNAFEISHRRFLVTLADHAAIALANAQLFDERQSQIDNLQMLRRFSLELLSATSVREVMKYIVQATMSLMHAKDVHLYLYDQQADELDFGWSMYDDGQEGIEATPPSRDGRSYNVARSGGMQFIADMRRFKSSTEFRDGAGYRAVARVALKRGDNVIGLLVITFREAQYFEGTPHRTLELVTNQAAIALENAMLFEEVRSARDAMQVILDNTREGMILLNESGHLLLFNPAVERLVNYRMRTLLGRPMIRSLIMLRQNMKDDPVTTKFLTSGLRDLLGMIRENPYDALQFDFELPGEENIRNLRMTLIPVVNNANQVQGRLVVLRDISEEKQMEAMREEVADTLVHDLRAPLASVISSMQLINDLIATDDLTEVPRVADIARSSADYQWRMIGSLLELSKMITIDRAASTLHDVANAAVERLSASAEEAHLKIRNLVPADLPSIELDQSKIERVFNNLLDNAIRHTPEGGEIRLEAMLIPGRGGVRFVQVNVTDTGKGVPEWAREKIFDKFEQVDKSALRGHRGSGLGLTFCRRVVEAHGGQIWVDRGPEGGAAFCFTLPLEVADDHETANGLYADRMAQSNGHGDDHKSVRMFGTGRLTASERNG